MKLSELKTNEIFKTDSGVRFKKLPMTPTEKRRHPDRIKVEHDHSKRIFYFTDILVIKIK